MIIFKNEPREEKDKFYMSQVLALSEEALLDDLFPIASLLVDEAGLILGFGQNQEKLSGSPLDHGEIVAIRDACKKHGAERLKGATIYTNCEPCPMCLGAIYWSEIGRIVYAASIEDTHKVSFNDLHFHTEFYLERTQRKIPCDQVLQEEAFTILEAWHQKASKYSGHGFLDR